MLHIHSNARTTPATRVEIARSTEPSGTIAKPYSISSETVRKWRKRGAADCLNRSAKPHQLPWKAGEEERAIVCTLRRTTNFPLDDLTFVVCHFLPHLNRDSIWRNLKAESLFRNVFETAQGFDLTDLPRAASAGLSLLNPTKTGTQHRCTLISKQPLRA